MPMTIPRNLEISGTEGFAYLTGASYIDGRALTRDPRVNAFANWLSARVSRLQRRVRRLWQTQTIPGVTSGGNQRFEFRNEFLRGLQPPRIVVLENVDYSNKPIDQILKRIGRQTGRKSV